jgi:hypothetical protein
MNHNIRVSLAAGLALLAAACSAGGPASTGSASTGSAGIGATSSGSSSSQLVGYAQCLRSHGVPNFPDPTSAGLPKVSAQELKVSSSQLQAAQGACQHLLPAAGTFQQQAQQCLMAGDCPPALVQQMLTAGRKFAQCMRSHGVPNWPDPSIGPGGRPAFNLVTVGITHSQTHSAPISATIGECQRLDPAPLALEEN